MENFILEIQKFNSLTFIFLFIIIFLAFTFWKK